MLYPTLFKLLFGSLDWIRMQNEHQPAGVKADEDISYSTNLKYDLYQPEQHGTYPVIINVYGGAWVYGSRAVYRNYCMQLARYGFKVVNYDYRLAPEHRYPAPLEDLNVLLHHLQQNGTIDDTVYAIGDSAGAQILAQYMTMVTNDDYAAEFKLQLPQIHFQAAAFNCGIFDPVERVMQRNDLIHWYLRKLLTAYAENYSELRGQFNFENYINSSFPPVYIANSVQDPLVGRQPELIYTFKKAHIPFIYKEYGHGQPLAMHNFQLPLNVLGRKCMEDELTFFKHHR